MHNLGLRKPIFLQKNIKKPTKLLAYIIVKRLKITLSMLPHLQQFLIFH